jgi:hypothetical protein
MLTVSTMKFLSGFIGVVRNSDEEIVNRTCVYTDAKTAYVSAINLRNWMLAPNLVKPPKSHLTLVWSR